MSATLTSDLGAFEYDPTVIIKNNIQISKNFNLIQNHPNPFNPSTTIKYSLPGSIEYQSVPQLVNLKVYDLLGREVATLVDEEQPRGNYEVVFYANGGSTSSGDTYDLPSGLYFYRIEVGDLWRQRKCYC